MRTKRGFSLIEVIIFCFIAITLLTLFVGLAINSKEFARTVGCVNNMKTIAQAIENFQADYKSSPNNIGDLYPQYITNARVFKCPADRTNETNSYEKFYIGRHIYSEKSDNIFLACPRHYRNKKTVAAYLSYAVDIGRNEPVTWGGFPAEYGAVYTGGQLRFADGTTATIIDGKAGLVSSFVDNTDKIYSIIYTPHGSPGTIKVDHEGDSKFEVITPAVIAGVEGTQFVIQTTQRAGSKTCSTAVNVTEGKVFVEDRSRDTAPAVVTREQLTKQITVLLQNIWAREMELWKMVPRKPQRCRAR